MAMRRKVEQNKHGSMSRKRVAPRVKPLAACLRALFAGQLLTTPFAHGAGLPEVQPGGQWKGAQDPRLVNGGIDMVIDQTAKAATLDWKSFNIDLGRSVRFNQPGADAVALNRIHDADPSHINGKLSANGQIYLINQNGIVFGDHAQVNVNTLVASTLNIDPTVFENGILGAVQDGKAAFVADSDMPAEATIEVQKGAQLSADQGAGGRILILAPNVLNSGDIHTPDGQAVLAGAKDSVYLAQSGDPNLRGVLVEVNTGGDVKNVGSIIAERGNVSIMGMTVNQEGLVRATSTVSLNGSIRLVAGDNSGDPFVANRLQNVPSVRNNFLTAAGGDLTLGETSVTEVIPEGTATATDGQTQPKSFADLAGRNVTLSKGSRVTVTGGDVNVRAQSDLSESYNTSPQAPEAGVGLRIESGATIDVSGDATAVVPVSRNVVSVEARGNELADSPLQRSGPIRNQVLQVDIRQGTPFLNTTGAEGLIERGVNERLAQGGNIQLQSAGDVVVDNGASLDISGGRVTYTGGNVSTSQLVTPDGRVIDIADADPNRTYVGVLGEGLVIDHAKWGVTKTYTSALGHYEPGYVEGKDAGKLSIETRRLAFNGTLYAGSTAGVLQRQAPDPSVLLDQVLRPFDQRPYGGDFAIALSTNAAETPFLFGTDSDRLDDPAPGEALTDGRATVLSAQMLERSGVSTMEVSSTGRITVAAPISLPDNGELRLNAGAIDIDQDIHASGGTVSAIVQRSTGDTANGVQVPLDQSALHVADGVRVDVSGRWTNDSPRLNPGLPTAPVVIDGGKITLTSGGDLVLGHDSVLDVSGGAQLTAKGKLNAGKGGAIALTSTDNRPGTGKSGSQLVLDGQLRGYAFDNGGSLALTANQILVADGARLDALLNETQANGSPRYQLSGGGASVHTLYDLTTDSALLVVDPALLRSGGFDSFALTATRNGLEVAPGTHIALDVQNRLIDATALASYLSAHPLPSGVANQPGTNHPLDPVPSATPLDSFTRLGQLPDYLRGAVDLQLASRNAFGIQATQDYPVLSVGTGADIQARRGANLTLTSDTDLRVDGRLEAPAGNIGLTLNTSFDQYVPQQMIWLGPHAQLSADGATVLQPSDVGLRQGDVLDAGNVTLQANLGAIVTAAGSRISVDGAKATLDLPTAGGVVPRSVAGRAGAISLTAAESVLLQGELSGHAAQPGAAGGALTLALDPSYRTPDTIEADPNLSSYKADPSQRYPNDPRVINISAFTGTLPTPGTALPQAVEGQAFLSAQAVTRGGFDALALSAKAPGDRAKKVLDGEQSNGIIRFTEDTDLSLRSRLVLDAPTLVSDAADVTLAAPYVALGSTDTAFRIDGAPTAAGSVVNLAPTAGDGRLHVGADRIDLVGDTVLQGFGKDAASGQPAVDLVSRGDILLRGTRIQTTTDWSGSLRAAGDLRLQAQQIYPATLSQYRLAVEAPDGAIDIYGQNGTPGQPLSAGGAVTLSADNIGVHAGARVRAPIGAITLTGTATNAAGASIGARNIVLDGGSLLSVSANGLTIPFGFTQFKQDLVLPLADEGITLQFVANPTAAIDKPLPEKRIALTGDAIDIQPGAQFDLSGGGDVRATEFIPGPGGSKDILLADLDPGAGIVPNGSFAILPRLGSAFAPFDPIDTPAAQSVQGIQTGDTLVLDEGIAGLPAGEYAVLPARYALFGGYLVTPVAGTRDMLTGLNQAALDGVPVLAGRLGVAATGIRDSRTQGFAIEDGAQVRLRAEYAETSLDTLFADSSARTPRDAGNLTVAAADALRLAGSVVPTRTGGRGSEVDIVATALSLVGSATGGAGVELLASDLAGLNADSLLIGGTRTQVDGGVRIEPGAAQIDVAGGVDLNLPELILVADRLNIGDGATPTRLSAVGANTGAADNLVVAGNAAVAMVSTAAGATVSREAGDSVSNLNVADGATLSAAGSVVLDANGDVNLGGTLDADGGTLSLGGSSVSLGQTEGRGLSGLVLSNADLAQLAGSDLTLRSSSSIDLYGAVGDATAATTRFARLTLDAQGIAGHDNAGTTSTLAADRLALRNHLGDSTATAAPGDGGLLLRASRIDLGTGDFNIGGFARTGISADSALVTSDSGTLALSGDLVLSAPVLTATGGADHAITATGLLTAIGGNPALAVPADTGAAGKLRLQGAAINFAGNALLPSGSVMLSAAGDVALNTGASIDVAGRSILFADHAVGAPGGSIVVQSDNGSISVADGVTLDASGAATGGDAGSLAFSAPQGTLAIAPTAILRATDNGAERGEFLLDAARLTGTGGVANALSALNDQLEAGGFLGRRDLRLRQGDLQVERTQTWHAHEVKLTADSGRLVIDGTLDASGAKGGSIELAAGDALDVNGTLDAHATGADGNGGSIRLAALDADGDDTAHNDVVNLNAGAVLDLRGGANGIGGSARVRGRAFDANGDGIDDSVAVGALDATLVGAAHADVEGVQTVTDADGVITDTERDAWRARIDGFMQHASATPAAGWRLVPGLEIDSAGDLTLPTTWDLYAGLDDSDPTNDWRFGAGNDLPLTLTLRAAGNVLLDGSLTDGFVDDQFTLASNAVSYQRLAVGESSTYRIAAGADLSSADVLATAHEHLGDLSLVSGATVRTGTGDIDVVAGGNLDIGQDASIYTAGLNAGAGPLAGIDVQLQSLTNLDLVNFIFTPATGEDFLLGFLNQGQFPVQGGDVRFTVGGDLVGHSSAPNVADWQPRVGGSFNDNNGILFENLPTHWAIAFQNFTNGIGALGGGDVTARIGGDMRDVAVALPTTGKPNSVDIVGNDETALTFAANPPTPVVYGGGDLDLEVGGNLSGGAVQVDRGVGRVRIGGVLGDAGTNQQPYFAIADTRLDVQVRDSADVGGILNSTALQQTNNLATMVNNVGLPLATFTYDPVFFSYSPDSRADLTTLAGDAVLHDPAPLRGHGFALYPASLQVRSLQQGIDITGEIQTFPSAQGQLDLLAENDIAYGEQSGGATYLIQSDADPALLPDATHPAVVFTESRGTGDSPVATVTSQYLTPPSPTATSTDAQGRHLHAATPVHAGDTRPNLIVSRSGSITGKDGPQNVWEFLLAKQSLISAGKDIRDMSLRIQHEQETDLSLIQAQGDVVQTLSRDPGNGSLSASQKKIEIAGPGRLDVLAGGNLDLGTSAGVVSIGNTSNPALSDNGAGLVLAAGLAQGMDYDAFIKTYLEDSTLYTAALNDFLAARGIDPAGNPLDTFRSLSRLEQRALVLDIFFNELKESGTQAETSHSNDYSRGFAAIATLFPGAKTSGPGDISTPVSVVKTVDGGSIDLLAPYGDINAGATFRAIEKNSDQLGVITGRGGDINVFLDGDLQVNRERVFALQGSLLAWSSNGSIDAGKGAKTVVSVPDPIVTTDANGNTVITFPPAVDGSGLSASGNAYLFAPRGTINAGDAGIRVKGNLIIGAVEVIGSDNIDVGGTSVGVPVAAGGVDAGVVDAGSIGTSATSLADASTSSVGGSGNDTGANDPIAVLSVKLLGFGKPGGSDAQDASCQDDDTHCKRQ